MDKKEKNDKPVKNRKRFRLILNISIIVFSVVLLAVEGVIYYQRSYLTPFWVNGQSMYPTLNGHATDKNGNELGPDPSNPSAHENYTVDYGVMDCHKNALKKLRRFDIIVTKYTPEDTSDKIKRILALPGETIQFKNDGDLYINGEFVEQPISETYIRGAKYPAESITLSSNQYYVCGDNRSHSSDSRNTGPLEKELITGRAVAICGTAKVYVNSTGNLDIKDIKYTKPRFLR